MIDDKKVKKVRAKTIKAFLFGFLVSLPLIFTVQAQASTAQMNQTMVRMINQIEALFPLIAQASKEQDKTARVQFHFDEWVDASGVKHDGLKENLLDIRVAIINQINQSNLTPKKVAPISGDYVGR